MKAKLKYTVITVLIFAAFLVFISFDPESSKHEAQLKNEFSSIAVYPTAKLINYSSGYKRGQAHVDASYYTDANYSKVKYFYNLEFLKHGWVFEEETGVTDWGKTVPGAKIINYKKGQNKAALEYEGKNKDFTYNIGMGWGSGY